MVGATEKSIKVNVIVDLSELFITFYAIMIVKLSYCRTFVRRLHPENGVTKETHANANVSRDLHDFRGSPSIDQLQVVHIKEELDYESNDSMSYISDLGDDQSQDAQNHHESEGNNLVSSDKIPKPSPNLTTTNLDIKDTYETYCVECEKKIPKITGKSFWKCTSCSSRLRFDCKICHEKFWSYIGLFQHSRKCLKYGNYQKPIVQVKKKRRIDTTAYPERMMASRSRPSDTIELAPSRYDKNTIQINTGKILTPINPKLCHSCPQCGELCYGQLDTNGCSMENIFECSFCPFKSFHEQNLQHHLLNKHNIYKFEPANYLQKYVFTEGSIKELASNEEEVKSLIQMRCAKCDQALDEFSFERVKVICKSCSAMVFYQCKRCNSLSENILSLFNHAKYNCKDGFGFACSLCPFRTPEKNLLEEHIKEKHEGEKLSRPYFECAHCSYVTFQKKALLMHLRRGHTSLFSNKNYNYIKNKMQMYCLTCDKVYKEARVVDKNPPCADCNNRMVYQCKVCEVIYNNLGRLYQHMRYECKTTFSCNECGLKCSQKGNLARHVTKMHLRAKFSRNPFHCAHCSFVTCRKKKYLVSHLRLKHRSVFGATKRVGTSMKANMMMYCSACCSVSDDVKSDKRETQTCTACSNILLFQCKICNALMKQYSSLHRHLKNLRCNRRIRVKSEFKQKNSTFRAAQDRNRYIDLIQAYCPSCDELKKATMSKKRVDCDKCNERILFQCKRCNASYTSSSSMYNHLKFLCEHRTVRREPIPCEFCGYKAQQKKYLRRHMKRVHKIPDLEQPDAQALQPQLALPLQFLEVLPSVEFFQVPSPLSFFHVPLDSQSQEH